MTPVSFTNWLAEMKSAGLATTDAASAKLLGIHPNSVVAMKRNGADLRTGLACRAVLHRLEPYENETSQKATIPRICSIDGCGKPRFARDWCGVHYDRWLRHGDPLGKAAPRPPRKFFEEVVLPYDGDDCLIWPFTRNNNGYGSISVAGRHKLVTRHVCEQVNGPAPTPRHEAAHSCGRGHEGCVTKRHLSWKTRTENMADRVAHGTNVQGERQGNAKLSEADVKEIMRLKGTVSQRELGQRFAVTQSAISDIHTGKHWRFLTAEPSR